MAVSMCHFVIHVISRTFAKATAKSCPEHAYNR